jgi:hypothetical protein
MEGQSLILFFGFSGGALVLLFLVVLWQRGQIVRYETEIHDASLNLAKQQGRNKHTLIPLLDEAPFPMCYTDMNGKILATSRAFRIIAGEKVKTLDDFAKVTGAHLANKHSTKRQQRISLQTASDDSLRHFSLTAWPALGTNGPLGMVYSMLEHTTVVRRNGEEHSFTQELLTLEQELLKNIQQEPDNSAVISELSELTTFIQTSLQPQLIQRSLFTYKPHFRKQGVAVTSTLPRQMYVVGYADESLEVLNLMLAAVAEHAPSQSTVRLHVGTLDKKVIVSLSFPGLHYTGSINDFFSFGTKSIRRQSQVRAALARLLMGKQHGNLALTLDDEGVIVAEISFVAAKKGEEL